MKTSILNKATKMMATFALIVAGALAAFAISMSLSGCSSDNNGTLTADTGLTGGVAGSVNGTEIKEDRITRAVNNFRINYGYTEDDAWKEFLKNNNYTCESMRYTMLSGYIDQELVKQCADQLGVSVTDEEIDEKVQSVSSQYSSQEAWENAVEEVGYENGVEGYKEELRTNMLTEKVKDIYEKDVTKELEGGKALRKAVNEQISTYDGAKKSSMVIFASDNEIQAKNIRLQIARGEISMSDAAKKYSIDTATKDKGGDMGWDVLNQYNEEYTDILADLKKVGQVSKAIKTDSGWVVVELTDIYKAPKKVSDVKSVPEDFVTAIKESTVSTETDTKYDEWLGGVKEQQTVVVNPMPDNVPYKVDLSDQYTEEEMQKINDDAYNDLIGKTEETEEEVSGAEGAAAEASSSSATEGAGASSSAAEGSSSDATAEGSSAAEGN